MNTRNYSKKICLSTNYSCNLNCIYCYEKNKQDLRFSAKEALPVLLEQLSERTKFGTKIKLHGGEPFLVFNEIKQLCESLWSCEVAEQYHFHITTNGTLIHGEIQDWLYQNKDRITIKLSLDGDKHSNDINRPKSFDLIDLPFFLDTWPDISVNMTITQRTIPYLSENINFLHSTGFKHIVSHFALLNDWSGFNLERVLYSQLFEIIEFYIQNPEIKPCYLFCADISRTLEKPDFRYACNVGHAAAYDFQSKKYYPCHMCFPSMAGEQISKKLLDVDFTNVCNFKDDHCAKCPFVNICVTCYAENYISRGAMSRRDMPLCRYQKVIFAAIFKYEYERILKLEEPKSNDIRKMLAIQKWSAEIENIVQSLK